MPRLETLLTFAAAVLAMQVAPGPDTALLVKYGVGQGGAPRFGWRLA